MPAGTLRETQSASRVGLESDVKALFVGGLRCVGHGAGLRRIADDNDLVKRCGQLVLVGLVRPVAERHDDDVGIDADGLAAGDLLELDGPLADAGERVLRQDLDAVFLQQRQELVLCRAVDGRADFLLHLDDRDLVVGAQIVRDLKADMAAADAGNPEPVSYGLNSQLTKDDAGRICERVWKLGGMYSPAIERIVYWLEKAQAVAKEPQKTNIAALVSYYKTGDLKEFDRYNIGWVKDTVSNVDFVNGFIEDYGDPLGRKASWEANVNFMDTEACHRTEVISDNAQWFEDHSPVAEAYRKPVVRGVSAKVITVAMLGGDCYPATPIGINLPNADWIRKEYGSKSVTIDNITYAYDMAAHGNGFNEEFVLRAEDRERMERYGKLADDLHTDLHECLGHGSGQLAPGVKGGELKSYGSTLEETRADLFGLYYLGDPKLVELGLIPSLDVAKAGYAKYILNGMMTQLARIEPGKNVEESHMRNRKLICEWCYERGKADKVIELVKENGKTYAVVNDFGKLRDLFGQMLREVQRIKSEGDYEAGKALVEQYAVTVDPELHKEVRDRYYALDIEPYGGFVNPEYELVEKDGRIVDVKISYPADYVGQMLGYAKDYSFLPNIN